MSDTPAKAGLRTEIATIITDPTVPQWTDMLRPTDEVLAEEGRDKGLKIYEEVERDPLAHSVLQKRKLGLIQRDWEVEPGGKRRQDKKAAELAERVVNGDWGLSFDKVCLDLLDATLKGFAVAEIVWDIRDGFVVPAAIKPRNQRRFVFGLDGELRMLNRENSWTGIALPERKFIVHRYGDKLGDPYGRGLGHQLYWWCFFKRLGVQFWLTFAEKFGSPTVVGKVPTSMSVPDEDILLEKLENIAQQTAMTIPDDAIVEFLEASRSGQITYPDLVEYCDRMITVAVLGETLTTSEGNAGSRALGQVHQGVKDEIIDADSDLLSATLNNQMLTWLTELNYPDAVPPRVWRPRPSEEEAEAKLLQEKVKAANLVLGHLIAMRNAGYEPEDPSASIADQFEGKWVYVGMTPEVEYLAKQPAPPAVAPALAGFDKQPTAIDHLVADLDTAAGPAMAVLVGQLRDLLDQVEAEGGDLTDVLGRLAELYPAMDPADLAAVLGQGMTLANLTGRLDVADAQ